MIECPDCGAEMKFHPTSKYGPFLGCTRFPACKGSHKASSDGRPLGIPGDARTRRARQELLLYRHTNPDVPLSKPIAQMTEQECRALLPRTVWDWIAEEEYRVERLSG